MKKLFYIIMTTLLLFSLNIISMDFDFTKNIKEWLLILIIILLIFLTELFRFKKFPSEVNNTGKLLIEEKSKKRFFTILWVSLSISIFLSNSMNSESQSSMFFLLFSVPIFFINKVPKLEKYKDHILYPSAVFSFLPFLVILFYIILQGGKNNVVGVLTSFTGIILLTMINEKAKKRKTLFMLMLGVIFMFLILINGSRAGLLSFVLGVSCFFFSSLKKEKYRVRLDLYLLIHGALTIIVIAGAIFFDKIYNLLFNKWNGNSDISSGRELIWQETIKDANWFGHGSEYFYQRFYIGDAHNIFIQILGQYGLITLFLFLVMIIYLIVKLVRLNNVNYNAIFLTYFILGLFENVLFINFRFGTITFIIWIYIGLLLEEKYNGDGSKL